MNKIRRNELHKLYELISSAKEELENIRDDEDEYKENIPENMQSSERYEKAESAVYTLEEAVSYLEQAIDSIEEAQE